MSSKIFVANFPFSTTSEELEELFGQHGEVVSAKVATDRETGRSRGFGFVEMGSPDAAATAIQQLNGFDLGGRPGRARCRGSWRRRWPGAVVAPAAAAAVPGGRDATPSAVRPAASSEPFPGPPSERPGMGGGRATAARRRWPILAPVRSGP
jgi:hypothetical protein